MSTIVFLKGDIRDKERRDELARMTIDEIMSMTAILTSACRS